MRIIHTSDWHLGKTLDGFSRLEEQECFLKEFIEIVHREKAELVILAGDIFDNGNPSAKAEMLFYQTLKEIASEGERAILVIAGNHDSPERLEAILPLAYEQGIVILGTPKSTVYPGKCGNFKILEAGEGFIELSIKGENAVVITLPYPSEKRLEELLTEELEEAERQKSYAEKVEQIFRRLSTKYREDTVNIAVSHLFVLGGEATDSERPIQLGGGLAVEVHRFPEKAQYIALGHLHKTQRFYHQGVPVVYSGSPIQYSKNERNNTNCVFCVEVSPRKQAEVRKIFLKNYKPIEVWQCESIEEALEKCHQNQHRESWVYMEIKTKRVLLQEEIKAMKELRKDLIEIKPILEEAQGKEPYEKLTEQSIDKVFQAFYKRERSVEPTQEILDLFLDIIKEEEEAE